MSLLGTLVVKIAAELRQYKADLGMAAKDTADAAQKIETTTAKAGAATQKMGDDVTQAGAKTSQAMGAAGNAASSAGNAFDAARSKVGTMTAAFTLANLATNVLEFGMSQVGKAVDYAMDSAKMAARYETLGVVMQTVGRNAGYSGQQMIDASKGVQALGITMLESRDSVTKMASAQIDLSNASKLARVAQDAAVIGGINSSEALKSLVYGIQSAQTDVLRTIGINVSFEASYKKLATQLGTTSEALTEQQKTNARTNAVMEEGSKIAGAYEDAMGTAGKQLTSMARYSEDAQVKLGAVFNESMLLAIATYTGHLKESNSTLDELTKNNSINEWSQNMASTFAFLADSARNSFSVITGSIDTVYTAMRQSSRFIVGDYQGMADAGKGWSDRMGSRINPENQMQVQLDKLRTQKAADAKTLHMPDKTTIVFETPEQKAAYQDGLAGIKKFLDDRQKAVDTAAEAMAAALKKNRTPAEKTKDAIDSFRKTQSAAGVDLNSPEVKAAEAAIAAHGKVAKAASAAPAKAQLALDLEQNKIASEALTNNFANAEKIMEARRAAGLINEREYYAAKLGFLHLNSAEQERLLQLDIERMQKENLTGKNKTDNLRKIADAQAKLTKVREGAAASAELLGIQEAAANKKIAQSYLDASTAANAYIETVKRQNAREVAGIGKGTEFRSNQAGRNAIEDKQTTQRQGLEGDLRRNQIDRSQFDAYLAIVNDTYSKETAAYDKRTEDIKAKQADWVNGATEAFANYQTKAQDVAGNTAAMFTSAFDGLTDGVASSIASAITSGKSLEDSLKSVALNVADAFITSFIKIQIQKLMTEQAMTAATVVGAAERAVVEASGAATSVALQADVASKSIMMNAWEAMSGAYKAIAGIPIVGPVLAPIAAGAAFVAVASIVKNITGSRELGGPVSANSLYQVNERGPELLSSGGKDFLMMGSKGGTVTPNNQLGGGGSGAITIINQTTAKIGKVTERVLPNGERALIIEEAVAATAAQFSDPNSRTSRSIQRNFSMQRSRG